MPNHIHLIAVPHDSKEGLARAIGAAHRRYTRRINLRENWRGHLWQEIFASFPLDEVDILHRHERTGRLLGENGFVKNLEKTLGRK